MTNETVIVILGELKKCYLGGIVDALDFAIEAVKAQKPRVMTLEDLRAIYDTNEEHIWPYDTPPYLYFETRPNQEAPSSWHGWLAWREIKWMLEDGYFHCNRDDYGKTWRCWTSRPDEKRRAETPWERLN